MYAGRIELAGSATMTEPYPRDMIGYSAEPPHARWPGEARLALQFVINYEEGAENAIFHGDPAAEAFLSEWVGAQPTLGMRNMNMESLYEYGSRAGFWRLHRAFTARNLPVTVYGVAMALERNPSAVAPIGRSRRMAIAGSTTSMSRRRSSANTSPRRSRCTQG
jgi:hypothetical protein